MTAAELVVVDLAEQVALVEFQRPFQVTADFRPACAEHLHAHALAERRRYVDFGAQRGLGERHRHVDDVGLG